MESNNSHDPKFSILTKPQLLFKKSLMNVYARYLVYAKKIRDDLHSSSNWFILSSYAYKGILCLLWWLAHAGVDVIDRLWLLTLLSFLYKNFISITEDLKVCYPTF